MKNLYPETIIEIFNLKKEKNSIRLIAEKLSPETLSNNPWHFPHGIRIFDCQKINHRIPVAEFCLEKFDKENKFKMRMIELNRNYLTGFPDFVGLIEGDISFVIEMKHNIYDQLTYSQGLWLEWFSKKIQAYISYINEGFSLACFKSPKERFILSNCDGLNPPKEYLSFKGTFFEKDWKLLSTYCSKFCVCDGKCIKK